LYGLHPDAFVPARDDAVAEARQAGDRDLARAIARLRRPTRAAWLANLLARERAEQLEGLLALADDLAAAQRTLDGGALRALSAQRSRLVAAMAREGGRLAGQAGDSATESVVRDLTGILDAALADPAVADEVRSGRLTRTVSYSGFGPGPGSAPPDRPRAPAATPTRHGAEANGAGAQRVDEGHASAPAPEKTGRDDEQERVERERAERERAEAERRRAERAEREQALADAERAADDAKDQQETADAARADADAAHESARAQVADLAAELEAARERERTTSAAARAATAAARDAAREASTAAARADRARARLAELP
jgi:hypothetical protein